MNKFTILSPLVLLATTALAQDSTCILQPSCSQLGYTSAEADCGNQKVLRCPFDVSQVACVGGSSGTSGGGGDYNPNDPNNELGDAIVLKVRTTDTEKIFRFDYGYGNIYVDCGNGVIQSGGDSGIQTMYCNYADSSVGDYIVKFSGDFKYFKVTEANSLDMVYNLIKLDKSGITTMGQICGDNTVGIIPPLPNSLEDATNMFYFCKRLISTFPKLPQSLKIGDGMFRGSSQINGVISELPSGLVNGDFMFYNTSLSGVVPDLPDTLTTAIYMFYNTDITGLSSDLPSSLTNVKYMFYSCKSVSGSTPTIPSGIDATTCGNYDKECYVTFKNSTFTNDGSWPSGAF